MRLRPWHVALLFALCLSVVTGAVGGISLTVVELARSEARARGRAELEGRVRLALWRIDSALAPVIARESARPPLAWQAESSAGASPLLAADAEQVLLHFEASAKGGLVSPLVPRASSLSLSQRAEAARLRLAELKAEVSYADLAAALSRGNARLQVALAAPEPKADGRLDDLSTSNKLDWQRRSASVQQFATSNIYQRQARAPEPEPSERVVRRVGTAASDGVMIPSWLGDRLLLLRLVETDAGAIVQGCLLDWEGLKATARSELADLLPRAELVPITGGSAAADVSRQLASLPAALRPNSYPGEPRVGVAVWAILAVAWSGLLLAILAVAALLLGTVALSERRADFVSAVTHELRTPLTTFRMYTEMLADGMVVDPDKRQRYLETLRGESVRLSHLVENVLAYARIERGRHARSEPVAVGELLERTVPRLEERSRQAGLELCLEAGEPERALWLRGDAGAVEQILFNLVDNAAKYAAGAADRRLHLKVERAGAWVAFRVSDHGPGLPPDARRRLFTPFSKSAERAASSAPGVGLGLALCRRLARAMRGELRHDRLAGTGASFTLLLRSGR